jgi:hypothetical protein
VDLPYDKHVMLAFDGAPIVAFRSSGLGPLVSGWSFIVDESVASEFWRKAALKVSKHISTMHAVPCLLDAHRDCGYGLWALGAVAVKDSRAILSGPSPRMALFRVLSP